MTRVLGLGSDLLRIERIMRSGARNGTLLLQRLLAAAEYDLPGPPDWRRVAECVASKEAFFKALGTGLVAPLRWTDVALLGSRAAPRLHLSGAAAAAFAKLGGRSCQVTLSGNEFFTLATVVLYDYETDGPPALAPPGPLPRPDQNDPNLTNQSCSPRAYSLGKARPLFWSDHQ